jgi:hypothetical protein
LAEVECKQVKNQPDQLVTTPAYKSFENITCPIIVLFRYPDTAITYDGIEVFPDRFCKDSIVYVKVQLNACISANIIDVVGAKGHPGVITNRYFTM